MLAVVELPVRQNVCFRSFLYRASARGRGFVLGKKVVVRRSGQRTVKFWSVNNPKEVG